MSTYTAHVFPQRKIGNREEVQIKVFDSDGSPIYLDGDPGPEDPEDPTLLTEHVNSETPHPVYDDGPSLTLLYANAKV